MYSKELAVSLAAVLRDLYLFAAAEVLTGNRVFAFQELVDCT